MILGIFSTPKLLSYVLMYRVVEGPVFCALALEFNEENVRP